MTITDYLLIPLILFTILLYPLLRKIVSLAEIFVSKYIQQAGQKKPTNTETTVQTFLNLKLLAYERIVLYIERMKPDSLVPRTISPGSNAGEYHHRLLSEIRQEFEYNLSQQLYLSENAWATVSNFKNNITTLINTAAADCENHKPAAELAKKILEQYITSDIKTDEILRLIKSDIQ